MQQPPSRPTPQPSAVAASAATLNCWSSHAAAQVKDTKKAKFKLGVFDPKLGSAIQEQTNIPCIANEMVSCAPTG